MIERENKRNKTALLDNNTWRSDWEYYYLYEFMYKLKINLLT